MVKTCLHRWLAYYGRTFIEAQADQPKLRHIHQLPHNDLPWVSLEVGSSKPWPPTAKAGGGAVLILVLTMRRHRGEETKSGMWKKTNL